MRKLYLFLLILIVTSKTMAQTSSLSVLQRELVSMLKNEGVLLTDQQKTCTGDCRPASPWKNNHQKKNAILQDSALMNYLVSNFTPPTFINGQNIIPDLTYSGQSLTRIGRYLIKNGDLTIINKGDPPLPIWNINQISIPSPADGSSTYILNYTMNNLFTNNGTVSAGASFQSYIGTKLQYENNVSKDKKMQLSIAAGVFENQLATLYQRARDGNISGAEFAPIYYLWLAYKNGQAAPGDQVISNFTGICFYTSQGVTNTTTNTFNAQVNGSGTFPFLSYGVDDKTNWSKTDELATGAKDYKIYLFKKPPLLTILTPAEILKAWNTVSTLPDPFTIKSATILANTPLVIQVKFGPIPTSEFGNIKLDMAYTLQHLKGVNFIDKITFNNDPKFVVNNGDGYYTFNISVTRNEDFIANNSTSVAKTITADFPLRIYFDNAVNGQYLETVYPSVKLQTETLPLPYLNPYSVTSTKDANFYTFKSNLQFDLPDGMTINTAPVPPKFLDVQTTTNANAELVNIIKNSIIKPTSNNTFEISFRVPVSKQYFSFTQPFQSFYAIVSFSANNQTYSRRCEFTVTGPDDQTSTTAQTANVPVTAANNEVLISNLNLQARVNDGRTVADVKQSHVQNGKLNVVEFVDDLKKVANVSVTTDNKYLIDNKYITNPKTTSLQ